MSSYPGDEQWAMQQQAQRAKRRQAATLSDEQLARLVNIADCDSEHVFEMEDYSVLELALRELQAHRAAASVSGGEVVERLCVDHNDPRAVRLAVEPVPQPAAQEVAPLRKMFDAGYRSGWEDCPITDQEMRDKHFAEAFSRVAPPALSVEALEHAFEAGYTAAEPACEWHDGVDARMKSLRSEYLAALQRARATDRPAEER